MNLRIVFILPVMLLLFTASLNAQQTGSGITGTVMDAKSHESLIGASLVLLNDKTRGTSTDINGQYTLLLPPGKQTIVCSFLGMKPDTFSVETEADKLITHHIMLKPIDNTLNVVVVSAGKYEQKVEDLTVSVEVLKPQLIESRNTASIDKALEQVPGLTILDNEPQIRGGSGFSFGVGSHVSTLVDGIPILQGDVGRTEWYFIPVENTEQVEVIKGAASVLYGSSALSGIINVRTAYPKDSAVTKARIYSGMYSAPSLDSAKWWNGTARYHGMSAFHSQQIKRCDLVLSIFGVQDHGYIGPPVKIAFFPQTDTITEKDVANKTGRFSFNFRWRPKKAERLNLGLNGNFMRSTNNFTLVWANDSSGIFRAYPGTMTLQDQTIFYLDPFVNYYTAGGFRHSVHGRYFFTDNVNGNNQSNQSRVYYTEYQFAKTLNIIEGLNLTGGIVMNQTFSHAPLFSQSGSPDNHMENWAGYTQLDKKFWKVLNFSLGFRGEYFRINGRENVTQPIFRTGLNLKLAKATFLRYSYGQGYRFPTIAEKFIFTNAGGITIFPNPDIQPETSSNTEAGLKQGYRFGKFQGFFDAAVFWQEYHNAIEYIYAVWRPDSVGFKFVNCGNTRVRGIDISILGEGALPHGMKLTLLGGYTYTLPQSIQPAYVFAQDNPAVGIPPNQLSYNSTSTDTTNDILKYRFQHIAKIDAELNWKFISVGGSWRYYSYMQNIDLTFQLLDRPNLPGSGITQYRIDHHHGTHVFDARIHFNFCKKYQASFIVSNIANLTYTLRPLKIESPRTIALQLSMGF